MPCTVLGYHVQLGVRKTPISALGSSQDPIFTPNNKLLEISSFQSLKISKGFSSKTSNWAKVQLTRLHFVRNSVHWGPKFSSGLFTTLFGPSGRTSTGCTKKTVNNLKNDSKLRGMKYLVKILFQLDKLISCLPSVAKSLVCDSQ